MAWRFFLALAAAAFAAVLFRLFPRRGDLARSTAVCGNDGAAGGASSTHTSTKGQEVANSSGYDYEVFLSFRGPDIREGFTDHLYTRLDDAGIRTFKDDEKLRIGEEFGPELLQAIKQSKILIPIFSKGYASSVWCLKELVQMIECRKNGRQKIMPIFYDVVPSEVRYQTGDYKEAFLTHKTKNRHDEKTSQEWMDALSVVGAINGWDLCSRTYRREGEFAKEVTEEIFRELKKAYLVVTDYFVSVDNHVNAIMEMIGAQTSETRIIGIHGMGGIGKTTIAKVIYNQLSSNFKDCCFLANIRETSERNGIECLQKQLIFDILRERTDINNVDDGIGIIKDRLSNKRILLLLDDVEKENHIDALVGKHDWFGIGSKIIVTTRNKDILYVPKVDHSYELSGMDDDRSLQLFSKHAFRRDSPLDKYIDQSNRAIRIADGLPLALEAIGSLLSRTEKEKWDIKLKELENVPPKDVQSKLEISCDALDYRQKHIFLKIACNFTGYEKDIVVNLWDESTYFPKEAMDVLENMSLIKINDDNKVWMHDQLRDLGREIVRRESNGKIEKQSTVWDPKQGSDFMRRSKGKNEVEALRVKVDDQQQYRFTDLLKNVIILDLSWTDVTDDWKGWSHLKVIKKLKVLDLSNCYKLQRLPDKVVEDLVRLTDLYLRGCPLNRLPDTIENLKRLITLDISETDVKELPDSIGKLQNLKVMKMEQCDVERIPDAFWRLEKLEEIEGIKKNPGHPFHLKIGDCIHKNQSLRILRLWGADLYELPRLPESLIILQLGSLYMDKYPDLSNLTTLKELDLTFDCSDWSSCGHVEDPLPRWIGNLRKLENLALCFEWWQPNLPTGLSVPDHLKAFRPPMLPSSLSSLHLDHCHIHKDCVEWAYQIGRNHRLSRL